MGWVPRVEARSDSKAVGSEGRTVRRTHREAGGRPVLKFGCAGGHWEFQQQHHSHHSHHGHRHHLPLVVLSLSAFGQSGDRDEGAAADNDTFNHGVQSGDVHVDDGNVGDSNDDDDDDTPDYCEASMVLRRVDGGSDDEVLILLMVVPTTIIIIIMISPYEALSKDADTMVSELLHKAQARALGVWAPE